MASLHDGALEQAVLPAAGSASENAWARCDPERLTDRAAMSADKAVCPLGSFERGRTRRIVGEQPLKILNRRWKRQLSAFQNVNGNCALAVKGSGLATLAPSLGCECSQSGGAKVETVLILSRLNRQSCLNSGFGDFESPIDDCCSLGGQHHLLVEA